MPNTEQFDTDFVFCTVCRRATPHLGPGPGGRPNAACVQCGSLERHRVMALLIPSMIRRTPAASIVLDVAPTTLLSKILRGYRDRTYTSIDFDPVADGRAVDSQASITMLPIRMDSVGFMLCSHVLEHVPDDGAAAREIARVLVPGGTALIQVPRRLGVPTDEDPSAPPAERTTRFGQVDHVRYYGDDFEERLEAAGLKVVTTSYFKILPFPLLRLIGATRDEELWIATTGADPRPFIDTQAATRALAISLMGSHDLEREFEAARLEAQEWKAHYEWLRNRRAVRMAAYVKRQMGRLTSGTKSLLRVKGNTSDPTPS
jgi:SAM-dependent methyltransferase